MSEKQDEALRKAAACEAHAHQAPSELMRDKFRKLRDSWLRIANANGMVGNLQRGSEAHDRRTGSDPAPVRIGGRSRAR
jgi:hypothetical protein